MTMNQRPLRCALRALIGHVPGIITDWLSATSDSIWGGALGANAGWVFFDISGCKTNITRGESQFNSRVDPGETEAELSNLVVQWLYSIVDEESRNRQLAQ